MSEDSAAAGTPLTNPLPIEAASRLAGDFFMSVDTALTLATLRAFGQQRTEEFEATMLRSHQEHFFLPGLEKLGLRVGSSDAVRCARYHCLSNALGGLRMRYAIESEVKAWVFYETPCWIDSPWSPGMSIAVFRPEFMLAAMRAWHANNGVALGNPALVFVVTELIARGDGRDAGYFVDLGQPAEPAERLLLRFGEQPPPGVELRQPDLDLGLWPLARQMKAWRNYALAYAGARIAGLAASGDPGAADIIDFGFRIALFQRAESLLTALAPQAATGLERTTLLLAGINELAGLHVDVDLAAASSRVRVAGGWLDRAPTGMTPAARKLAEDALARAWVAWCRHEDRQLDVRRQVVDGVQDWRFGQTGV